MRKSQPMWWLVGKWKGPGFPETGRFQLLCVNLPVGWLVCLAWSKLNRSRPTVTPNPRTVRSGVYCSGNLPRNIRSHWKPSSVVSIWLLAWLWLFGGWARIPRRRLQLLPAVAAWCLLAEGARNWIQLAVIIQGLCCLGIPCVGDSGDRACEESGSLVYGKALSGY